MTKDVLESENDLQPRSDRVDQEAGPILPPHLAVRISPGPAGSRLHLLWLGLLLMTFAGVGCQPDPSSPKGALSLFLRAVAKDNRPAAWALLAPESRKRYEQRAAKIAKDRGFKDLDGRKLFLNSALTGGPALKTVRGRDPQIAGAVATIHCKDDLGQALAVRLRRVGKAWRVILGASK